MKKKDLRKYKDEFIRLYKEGISLRKIGEIYGVSKASVVRYVKEDCELRTRGLTDEEKEQCRGLYELGLSINAIAQEVGRAGSTIKRYLSTEYGVVTNAVKKYEHLFDDIVKDYASGMSATEVANKYSIGRQTVMDYIAESDDVEARKYRETSRVYNLNEHYFDELDSEKSKILGMIFAKGRIGERHTGYYLDINVHNDRIDIINIITDKLYEGESNKLNYIDNNVNLRILSKIIYDKLYEYGIYTKLDNEKKELPTSLDIDAFWKGFIYAGATINKRTLHIAGFPKHISLLYKYFDDKNIIYRKSSDTGVIVEDKAEVRKLINNLGYTFIKDFAKDFTSKLEAGERHSWKSIINL